MASKDKKLTFIDLFAGIGGIRIGFERAGAKCVFSSEWDVHSQTTYEANFGEKPFGDITKIKSEDIPDHDILTGGFPCQSFSIIGKKQGFADIRGTLFFEVERILRDKKPKAFFLENVKQLVTHDGGRTFKVILERLNNLGYYVHYKVLNGLDFGVPQRRERIILVGFKKNYPFQFPTGYAGKTLSLDDILESGDKVDRKHYISEHIKNKLRKKGIKKIDHSTIWHENKSGNIGIHPYSCALRANASYNYLLVNGERRLTPREMLRLQGFPDSFKIVVPATQVRKQAGNAVVVPKMEAVAIALVSAMKEQPIPIVKQAKLFNSKEKNASGTRRKSSSR